MGGGAISKWARAFRVGVLFVLLISFGSSLLAAWFSPSDLELGATFSDRYAQELGLDWQEAYIAVLDDLEVKKIRIPVYWSQVEHEEGDRDYRSVDWMMDEAAKREVDVTLAIGVKVPRWPECYAPDWIEGVSQYRLEEALHVFMVDAVTRYKNHPALERWQIENEAFFPFGVCEAVDPQRIFLEVETVRRIDPSHPIQMTSSGEQSLWMLNAMPADVLGVSVYRWAWNPVLGYVPIPLPELAYAVQKKLADPFVDTIIVSELQAEPWFPGYWEKTDVSRLDQTYSLFTTTDLLRNIEVAKRIGVDEAYIWGVEWWYFLKENGDDRLWNVGRALYN